MAKKLSEEEKQRRELAKSIKKQITDWIYATYGVTFLPKYFFMNLEKIYKGEYKNLNRPVPPEDLFDMWQQKINYLNKVADTNMKKGKKMDGLGRISYDLAIILGRYDNYLEWKKKQEIANEAVLSAKTQENTIDYNVIKKTYTQNNVDEIDINSLIDEI